MPTMCTHTCANTQKYAHTQIKDALKEKASLLPRPTNMSRVHTKTVKKAAQVIIEMHLGNDFSLPVRGDRHYPQQEASEQDSRLCHASDEADSERSCERHLYQVAERREREER